MTGTIMAALLSDIQKKKMTNITILLYKNMSILYYNCLKKTIKFTNIYTFKKHEYKSWNINWISSNWKIKIIQYQKPNQLSEKNPNQLSEKNG